MFPAARPRTAARAALAAALLCSILGAPRPATAQPAGAPSARALSAVPAGFTDTAFASPGGTLTALAFTPAGDRLLATSQSGRLRVYDAATGSLLATALDLTLGNRICSDFERGLMGVAVDPGFASNRYLYLYYTFNKFNAPNAGSCAHNSATDPVNRVSRFTLLDSNVALTETVLIDNIPSPNGNHNGGDVHFGADGLLYVSTGDGGTGGGNARVVNNLAGKILRLAADGSVPALNPYAAAPGARRCGDPAGLPPGTGPCQEIIAFGLRNPFRFAFRSGTNQFYINDVGQGTWEEIDAGVVGADYGWNLREGPCPTSNVNCTPSGTPSGYEDPIHAYHHNIGCNVITGGAFVPGGVWPAAYDGDYLFADMGCGTIFRLEPSGNTFTRTVFANGLSGPIHLRFGPAANTQALYYTAGGQVRRILYTGSANRSPTAAFSAAPLTGDAPLLVTFDASASADLDGDPLTFDWDFGDGAVLTGTTSLTTTHTYTLAGVYTPTLIVRDNLGGVSDPAARQINVGNTLPVPAIISPSVSATFAVAQPVALLGSASDAEDGTLPASALSWQVLLHHVDQANPQNAHTHTVLPPTTGYTATFDAPQPEDLSATALSYLEVRLTAVDGLGASATVTRTVLPKLVSVTFATVPAGLNLALKGTNVGTYAPITTTQSILSWQGYGLDVSAAQPHWDGAEWLVFASWSDGGAAAHTILTPSSPTTYTATFQPGFVMWLPSIFR